MKPAPPLINTPDGFQLRPYQLQSVDDLQAEFAFGKSAVLLVAPTGSGKTAVGCHFVKQAVDQGRRCLWIAHRAELIRQASQRLAQDYRVRHGLIVAGTSAYDPRLPVQIASVQTLARREPVGSVGLLVIDEAHHATAATYLRVIESHPDALVLGLTATPWRLTGRQLGSLFDGIVAVANYPFLIRQGYLVRPRVFVPESLPDFGAVRMLGGDFDEDQAGAIMVRPQLVGDVVEQWRKHAAGGGPRSTIVFACTVAHSRQLVGRFREAGVPAEHLDGFTPDREREAMLERLARGEIRVVSNVMILSEGFDCPRVSCVVVARPTASRTLYLQMVGRALRPCPEIGKRDCVILDHAGNTLRHGLVSEITSYELDTGDTLDPAAGPRAACKECPSCHAVVGWKAPVCPECGYSFADGRRLPLAGDGELVEYPDPVAAPAGVGSEPAAGPRPGPRPTPPEAVSPPPAAPAQRLPAWFDGYLHAIRRAASQERAAQFKLLQRSLASATAAERRACVEAGLLSGRPDEWLDAMAGAGLLGALGLGCVAAVRTVAIPGYKGPTYYERTKRAVRTAPPELGLRLGALLFAAGVPDLVDQAVRRGFKVVRGYAPRSAEAAKRALPRVGVTGEQLEAVVELVREHEYIFDQIQNAGKDAPVGKLCDRLRKRLGPLWKEHLRLAEALWDGPVLAWLRRHSAELARAIGAAEEKLCEVRPEDTCPVDGRALLDQYQLPPGPWVRVMKHEIGQWCLTNPHRAQDPAAVREAADAVFAYYRQASPLFNLDLPFLHDDRAGEAPADPDPLGVRPLLSEAAALKTGEVAGWAVGYRRKAVVAVVGAVSKATNGRPTCRGVLDYVARVAAELSDVRLGELFRALVSPDRTPREVAEAVRRNRAGLTELVRTTARQATKGARVQLARALRDCGHFDEALAVAADAARHFGTDTSLDRLLTGLRKYCSNPDGVTPTNPDRPG